MKTKFLFHEGADTQTFKAGEIIIRQGKVADSMYSILQGEVDILLNGQLINTVKSGNIFGEMALIQNDTRSATVIAKTDCKVNIISQKRFLFLVQENPYFALDVMSILVDRIKALN